MKKRHYLFLFIGMLLFSCSRNKIPEFPVDIDQDISVPLSEISEEIIAITLEFPDEIQINPDFISQALFCEDYVIVASRDNIFIFNAGGKFVRTIGSIGQGQGEYAGGIRHLALDEKTGRLFVYSVPKIICYDLNGNFLKESVIFQEPATGLKAVVNYIANINYVNDELLLMAEHIFIQDEKGFFNHSAVYRLNDELQITDNLTIRTVYVDLQAVPYNPYEDLILYNDSTIYVYYSDLSSSNRTNHPETVLRDTMYRLDNHRLNPELKLKFKNNGIENFTGYKYISLCNIYRSARYIFAVYSNDLENRYYHFIHDTKTGECHNMLDGYTDDVNRIEKRVSIRPFNTNPERFYYWHTSMHPDYPEKPILTLYVGKLKQ